MDRHGRVRSMVSMSGAFVCVRLISIFFCLSGCLHVFVAVCLFGCLTVCLSDCPSGSLSVLVCLLARYLMTQVVAGVSACHSRSSRRLLPLLWASRVYKRVWILLLASRLYKPLARKPGLNGLPRAAT